VGVGKPSLNTVEKGNMRGMKGRSNKNNQEVQKMRGELKIQSMSSVGNRNVNNGNLRRRKSSQRSGNSYTAYWSSKNREGNENWPHRRSRHRGAEDKKKGDLTSCVAGKESVQNVLSHPGEEGGRAGIKRPW